jgi:hypothetical protein
MADGDPNAPWAWIPDSWRDAGSAIADGLHNAASNNALTSLGLAPMTPPPPTDAPGLAAFPPLVPPPVDDSLAGAPQGVTTVPAPTAAPDVAMPTVPPAAPPIPPPFDSAIAGAPNAAGTPALAQMPTLPPAPPAPMYPPMPMPTVPPGAPRTPAELDPTSPAAWNAAQNAEIDRLANESPEQFARDQAALEEARKNSIATDVLKASRDNLERATKDVTDYTSAANTAQQQTAQLLADAKVLAARHIEADPRGTFSKIRGVLAAFVGGLVAPQMGGRNVGLEAIQKEIEGEVAAQQAEIANQWKGIDFRKGAINDQFTRASEMNTVAEKARAALYQATIDSLQQKASQYDPRSSTVMRTAVLERQLRGAQAEALARAQESFTKQNLEIIKAGREQQDQVLKQRQADEAARHNRADEAHANYATSVEAMRAKADVAAKNAENEKFSPAVLGAMYGIDPTTIPMDMSRKDFATWSETKGKIADQGSKASEASGKQTASTIYNPVTGDPLTKKVVVNGKETEVPLTTDPTESKTIKDVIGATQEFVDAASDARRAIDDGPSVTSREKWAAISARLQNAKVKYIEIQKAKPSSKEMEAMGDHVFGPDFSDYTDRIKDKSTSKARLDALIDAAKRDAGTELTKAGYKGPVPILDTSRPPAAVETETDRITTRLNEDPNKRPLSSFSADDQLVSKASGASGASGQDLAKQKLNAMPADSFARRGYVAGILPSDLQEFDRLEAAARGKDGPEKSAALSALGDISTGAPHETYKNYAAAIIRRINDEGAADIPTTPETVRGRSESR